MPLLFAALFCLGTHSTVFGPIKYALLPQHLREDELVAGNALIEAGTFLAILLGTILGGSVVLLGNGAAGRRRLRRRGGASAAGSRRGRSRRRRRAGADAPRPRLLRDTIAVVGHVTSRPALLLPILAVSWFWLFGATVVSGLPVVRQGRALRERAGGDDDAGALRRGRRHRIDARRAAAARRGERALRARSRRSPWRSSPSICTWPALGAPSTRRTGERRRRSSLSREAGAFSRIWSASAMAGGLFTVPLYAILQHESEPAHRARVIAANNIINALAMAVAAVGAGGAPRAAA